MIVRNIEGFEDYAVAKDGTVWNWKLSQVTKPVVKKSGYVHIHLRANGERKTLLLHRIVYTAWNGKIPEGWVVDHDDGDRANCHADNLAAMTQKENIDKKFKDFPCPEVINPQGNIVKVTRPISDFCKEHRLIYPNFDSMVKGKRKSCAKWRLV